MISIKELDLRYSDTDQMGVIYHANYFTYFMQGRTKFLKDLGYEYIDFEKEGYMFPVRDAKCTFLRSIRLGEKVRVETRINKYTKIKTEYYHEIKNEEGELKARGYTTVVCVDMKTLLPSRMDGVFPQVHDLYIKLNKKDEE